MKNLSILACAALGAAFFVAPARAGVGAGLVAGSTGAGLSVTKQVGTNTDLRAQSGNGQINATVNVSGQPYNGSLRLDNQSLVVDFHPGGRAFMFTAGAANNRNVISATGTAQNGSITINGTTYTAAQAGSVDATASWAKMVPYLGVGFGPLHGRGGLAMELGAQFQGAPNVNVTANGSLASDPQFRSNLDQARQQIKDAMSKFNTYPVLNVRYQFAI